MDSSLNRLVAHSSRQGQSNDTSVSVVANANALTMPPFKYPSWPQPTFDRVQRTINDLPPEILSEILFLSEFHDSKDPDADAFEVAQQLSTVCRLWRHIMLDHSEIWARCFKVVDTPRKKMEMILQRVRGDRLDFELPALPLVSDPETGDVIWPSMVEFWQTSENADLLDKAMAQSRIFLAELSMADADILQWGPISARLPLLQKISLENARYRDCLVLDHRGLYDNERHPHWHTRSLRLVGCFFPIKPTFFCFLENLCIRDLDPVTTALTPQSWLNILAALPRLRRLSLEDAMTDSEAQSAFPDEHDDIIMDVPSVNLPTLDELTIKSRFHHIVSLITRLDIPDTCSVHISFHSLFQINTSTFGTFTSWLESRYNHDAPILGSTIMLQMSELACAFSNTSAQPHLDIRGEFMREFDERGAVLHDVDFTPDELLFALLAPLQAPCRHATDLRLYIVHEFDPAEHQTFWMHAFAPFAAVETLWLMSHNSFCFMGPMCEDGGLMQSYQSEQGVWKTRFLLPNLRSLLTLDVNFADPVSGWDNVSLGTMLLNLVKKRKKARRARLTNAIIKEASLLKGNTGKLPAAAEQEGLMAYAVRIIQ
ncbi:hypothetical protein JR316_0009106 [Psilocybe cubensis]|uniref:F-box domain-containing protein n=2 Tax=Psilocybe cubensis TaxID=181762 RepID=A0A8H7XWD8_PSICU|nr:hypothetical protein JR316_0009106 [Psilocybe cubensis]KAH9478649.1 hypothetical protein JR316_0009106 [Psilocybe cubensis]